MMRYIIIFFYRMPPIKILKIEQGGEESDGDGDLSGGESERSVSTRDGGRDSSEVDELDSDDSSEMDEGECARRRADCLDDMSELEHQFSFLREKLYQERITQVDTQLIEVKGGKSQEYLEPLQRLEENKRIRTEVAGILRQLRMTNIRNKSEAEEQAAYQNLEVSKIKFIALFIFNSNFYFRVKNVWHGILFTTILWIR